MSPETTVDTLMVELWMKISSTSRPYLRYMPVSNAVNQTVFEASAELYAIFTRSCAPPGAEVAINTRSKSSKRTWMRCNMPFNLSFESSARAEGAECGFDLTQQRSGNQPSGRALLERRACDNHCSAGSAMHSPTGNSTQTGSPRRTCRV